MRNFSLLAVSCLVLACGSVTSINPDGSPSDTGGTGGKTGSGGSMGSGGGTGSGGGVGSGGSVGSGGAGGSGGTVGSGGSVGSGGAMGTGGGTGSGGSIDAGTDHPADAGDECAKLRAEYDVAFKEARMCNPAAQALQCQATASASLPCGGCVTHVQSATTLDQIRAKWEGMNCRSGICPAIACIAPGTGSCVADPAGTGGTCTDIHNATTN